MLSLHLSLLRAQRLYNGEVAAGRDAAPSANRASNSKRKPFIPTMITEALAGIYKVRVVDESLCTSGQPTVAQLQEIAAAGFTTVVNLALHDDPRYSLPDEAGTVKSLGMNYVHIPVSFSAPAKNDLLEFFSTMKATAGQKVWVHCAANIRVSAFLGLYRVIELGWERQLAFAQMNDLWQPDEVWSSFIDSALESPDG
jgi:uncharacterized protein (TIGR01244 family)